MALGEINPGPQHLISKKAQFCWKVYYSKPRNSWEKCLSFWAEHLLTSLSDFVHIWTNKTWIQGHSLQKIPKYNNSKNQNRIRDLTELFIAPQLAVLWPSVEKLLRYMEHIFAVFRQALWLMMSKTQPAHMSLSQPDSDFSGCMPDVLCWPFTRLLMYIFLWPFKFTSPVWVF